MNEKGKSELQEAIVSLEMDNIGDSKQALIQLGVWFWGRWKQHTRNNNMENGKDNKN